MRSRRFSRSGREPSLNLAPLVDVVLLLVLFFMVSTTFITPESALPVQLPTAITGKATSQGLPSVAVNAKGQAFWQGRVVDNATLKRGLERALAKDSSGVVVLRADKDSLHGRVTEIMDLIRQAGAKSIVIAVIR